MSIALEAKSSAARDTSFMKNGHSLSLYRFTVDQYHRMIDAGVLGKYDRVQLLEGRIVDKMTHNPPHDSCVISTQQAISPLLPGDWHVRGQCAITTPDSEPEPDIAVVRGKSQRYSRRHPLPKDIGMIVEVGDATLRDDQTNQYRVYARCRIPIYWIVNLVDETVEVYTRPRGGKNPQYLERRFYSKEDSVPLVIVGKQFGTIAVRDLLPL